MFGKKLGISGDRIFFLIVLILVFGGIAVFSSAALGLLARENGAPWNLALTQLLLGLIPGGLALVVIRFMPQRLIMKLAPLAYVATFLFTLVVFIPGVGVTLNGATRWIDIGFTTIQPAEFLKIGVILMLAWYLAKHKAQLSDPTKGLIPFALIIGIPFLMLLMQPNTSTVLVTGIAAAAMYFLAGAPLRDFAVLAVIALIGLSALVFARPYLMERVLTYMDPSRDSLSAGYQIQQSLIAIGSGGFVGRGYGQSVQKFNYLPEPVGDSVFAVYGEEFGFLGAVFLVLLFAGFAARGFAIASNAGSVFGALLATGLTLLISISAFLNMGAMLAIFPLTGLPLPFISHGGTALFAALASVGLILNVAANRSIKRAK